MDSPSRYSTVDSTATAMSTELHFPGCIVAVQGVIGGGKSTLLHMLLLLIQDVQTALEPCELWQAFPVELSDDDDDDDDDDDGGTEGTEGGGVEKANVLDEFYKDARGKAAFFQNFTLMTRVCYQEQELRREKPAAVGVLERNAHGDRLFAKNARRHGMMSRLEYAAYRQWFRRITERLSVPVTHHVYLRVSVDTAMQRIRKRARSEEDGVPRDYIESLHALHEREFGPGGALPAIVLDGDVDFESMAPAELREWARPLLSVLPAAALAS